ncbi:hypothetical protein BJ973_006299 [Actinoplanes tereljensis]|uniref:DUF4307 domain-containing protein n=1 Tax=Paractinoplanes tereljensis TaxID=571912 RepID=UPI001EF28405|nr:DUF4307 domain-containing protein [Actinoplanes tereljensis]
MSETHTTTPVFPPGRYGRRRDGRRKLAGPIIALTLVVAFSVLISIKLYQRYGETDYQPQIVGWQVPSDAAMTIKFKVRVPAGGAAECALRARDYQGNEVGRRTVVVRAGTGETAIEAEETVTTTARGSVGDVPGCQSAP